MRTWFALCALGLVLVLATQAPARFCRSCDDPPPVPPPPPSCTDGATRSCSTTGNGCPGTQTCVNGAWSTCVDTGQCTVRLGCPVSRETINMAVSPDSSACTSYFLAQPGERIHVRLMAEDYNRFLGTPLDLYRQVGTGDTLAATHAGGWLNFAVSYYGNYRVCAHNTDWFFTHWFRITMDVAGDESPGGACDQWPDTCFGHRGPGCGFCTHTGRHDNFIWCAAQVGSQKHDTCCAHYPGGHWCGNVGYAGETVADQYCELPDCAPPSSDYGSPYKWCTAEFDKSLQDWLSLNEWNKLTDPTLLSYRPLANYATREPNGHWLDGDPTAESILFPDGQKMEYGDEEWCANGYHYQEGTGYVICGPAQ